MIVSPGLWPESFQLINVYIISKLVCLYEATRKLKRVESTRGSTTVF